MNLGATSLHIWESIDNSVPLLAESTQYVAMSLGWNHVFVICMMLDIMQP